MAFFLLFLNKNPPGCSCVYGAGIFEGLLLFTVTLNV